MYFIINEENKYRNNIFNNELNIDIKNVKIEKFIKTGYLEKKDNKKTENNREKQNFELSNQFLKWNSNSCKYDNFFFIYIFSIKYFLFKEKIII